MIKLEQKTAVIDGKKIAYVDARIVDGKHDYPLRFDDKTKKRWNQFLRAKGFLVGEVTEDAPAKVVEM